jgi:hypothetical protein
MTASIYKSGVIFASIGSRTDGTNAVMTAGGSVTVYCNGTTDYLEIYTYTSATKAYDINGYATWADIVGPLTL